MENLTINCLAKDYLCLRSMRFYDNTSLAWLARKQFMHTPGITSFEVSPFTGQVFIGFDRHLMTKGDSSKEAMRLLQEYFPELIASKRFKQAYYTLH